ncbi:(Fe-S)-binding protein [Candidatus Acetothermia bacterium]|nr:(Fe-S)-binding protein [Candidatus Acetothermia bacterium]MBI3643415.1 (Fe-S)-binding protein [Candidatus Acetothermia bacterium]
MHPTDISLIGIGGRVWLALLLVAGLGFFGYVIEKRLRPLLRAKPDDRFRDWPKRLANAFLYFLAQRGLFKDFLPGLMHAFIFWGFLIYAIRTLSLFISGFFPQIDVPASPVGNLYFVMKDAFALLVSLGCIYWLYQRLVARKSRLTLSWEGVFILGLILTLMISDLLIDGAHIALDGENLRGGWDFASAGTGWLLQQVGFSPSAITGIYMGAWWTHVLTILLFLNFLPLGKHFHIITSLPNVLFYKTQPQGQMTKLDVEGAFEREESLGLRTVKDLTWRDMLDLYSCTECGRCEDECPANHSGKILSPKEIILELRDQVYKENPLFGKSAGVSEDVVPVAVKADEIWACTTCMACVAACPVQINQLDKILEMRRNEVMMKDQYPTFFTEVFKGYDGRGNPWNMTSDARLEWTKGINVPILRDLHARNEHTQIDLIFFVGCATAFEPRNQTVARSLVKIMEKAGITFAILGDEESCTGDAARRIGHEYIFQVQAEKNIQTFSKYGITKILTACPHCYNTFKNEYPDFGGNYEVLHHSELIADLIQQGKLRLTKGLEKKITYHDSCYLGRYNNIYDPQRAAIDAIPGVKRVEMTRSRERGMCCGAGGGLMWVEEDQGKRVNDRRLKQALEVEPDILATACPFCMIMMEDGIKNNDVKLQDKDIAELVADAME